MHTYNFTNYGKKGNSLDMYEKVTKYHNKKQFQNQKLSLNKMCCIIV